MRKIVEAAELQLGMAADAATKTVREAAAQSKASMEKSVAAAETVMRKAQGKSLFHQVSIVGKLAIFAAVTLTLSPFFVAGWRLLTVATGEV